MKALAERGLHFVGAGISGGEEVLSTDPPSCPAARAESYKSLALLRWRSVAAHVDLVCRAVPISALTAVNTSSRWCTTASSTPTCSSSERPTT